MSQTVANSRRNNQESTPARHLMKYNFPPGKSGNPNGRPKKKPLTEALEKLLAKPEIARAIAKAMVSKARKGSVSHFESIADRVEGAVARSVEMKGEITHTLTTEQMERAARVLEKLKVIDVEPQVLEDSPHVKSANE